MPRIIIEQLNKPSYEFLEWICENGGRVDDDSHSTVDPEIIVECIGKGNFKFYKWLLTCSFIDISQKKHLVLIYSYALVEYIKFTEFTLVQRKQQVTHNSLMRICQVTPIDPFSRLEDVIEYVNWLIKMGRLSSLNPSVLASLVEFLMFKCDKLDNLLIVKKLLYMHMFIDAQGNGIEFIKNLFQLIKSHGETALSLIDLMDEAGILSSSAGREQIISLKEKDIFPDLLKKLKYFMIQSNHLSSFDRFMRMIREVLLLPRSYIVTDSHGTIQYFIDELHGNGIIAEFGILILRRLLIMIKDLRSIASERIRVKNCEIFLEKALFEGILVSFGITDSSILEITRMILTHGSQELMSNLHSKFKSNWAYRVGVNSVIREALHEEGISHKQLAQIIKSNHSDIDLSLFSEMKCKRVMSDRDVCHAVLDAICDRREKSSDSMELAEYCLAVILTRWKSHAGFAELLLKYMVYVSDSILRMILGKYGVPSGKLICEKIVEYILNNRKDFIRILIEARNHSQRFQELVDIDPHPKSIYNLSNNLIMGELIYDKRGGKLFERSVQLNSKCDGCDKYLRGTIYHDDEDSFDVYNCEKCKTSDAQASCNICFTHDDLKILHCGHCYCHECLMRFTWRENVSCPVCKKSLIISTILKTTEQVLTEYWVKLEESPSEVEVAAKALFTLYGPADEDESEESGSDFVASSD